MFIILRGEALIQYRTDGFNNDHSTYKGFRLTYRSEGTAVRVITLCLWAHEGVWIHRYIMCVSSTNIVDFLPLENRHKIALYRSVLEFIFLQSRASLLSSVMALGF